MNSEKKPLCSSRPNLDGCLSGVLAIYRKVLQQQRKVDGFATNHLPAHRAQDSRGVDRSADRVCENSLSTPGNAPLMYPRPLTIDNDQGIDKGIKNASMECKIGERPAMSLYNRIAASPSKAARLAPDAVYALLAAPRNALLVVVAAGAPPGVPPVAVPAGGAT